MPDWYNPEIHARIINASTFYLESLSYTSSLKRLNGGPLVRRFIENMDIEGIKHNPRKIYLYTAHEYTVSAFGLAHNVVARPPAYGKGIIMEKWRNHRDNVFVKVEYFFTFFFPRAEQIFYTLFLNAF